MEIITAQGQRFFSTNPQEIASYLGMGSSILRPNDSFASVMIRGNNPSDPAAYTIDGVPLTTAATAPEPMLGMRIVTAQGARGFSTNPQEIARFLSTGSSILKSDGTLARVTVRGNDPSDPASYAIDGVPLVTALLAPSGADFMAQIQNGFMAQLEALQQQHQSAGEPYVVSREFTAEDAREILDFGSAAGAAKHWTVNLDGSSGTVFPVRVVIDGRGRIVDNDKDLADALLAGGQIDEGAVFDSNDVILTAVPPIVQILPGGSVPSDVRHIGPGFLDNTEKNGLLYAGLAVAALLFFGRKKRS